MISVIIPCYNCGAFIGETIQSVLDQTYQDFEIIVVDDGSTDNSESVVKSIQDSRIHYISQPNSGVSKARNKGFQYANGKYIVFFDGDDIMSSNFLEVRIKLLERHRGLHFCCGPIETFPVKKDMRYGAAKAVPEELLLYDPFAASCPSNYLIKRSILEQNNLLFNERLSSTADRFFLLQLDKKAEGFLLQDGPLLYRITENSMSNQLTRKLVDDNEQYLFELEKAGLIPINMKKTFLFKIHYILGLGFIRTGALGKGMRYTLQAFVSKPVTFIKQALI